MASLTRLTEELAQSVSTLVDGPYGIRGVCLSLPAVVDSSDIRRVLAIPLSVDEKASLRKTADAVCTTLASADVEAPQ